MNNTVNFKSVKNFFTRISSRMGKLGAALLFPIATLPFAAILLRVGAQLPTGTTFADFVQKIVLNSGAVVFDNLPIIFAIGIAFGFAKDKRGEAALSAFIGMSLLTLIMSSKGVDLTNLIYQNSSVNFHELFSNKYDAVLANNVLNGIIAGSLVAFIYNRFNNTELPNALGFFSGRRLIPVLSIASIFIFGILYAIVFPWIGWLIYELSNSLKQATGNRWSNAGIMFVYGIINRLLIPFGLHQIPNSIFWFQLGSHPSALEPGKFVNGDINIFLSGVPEGNTAGTFQSGFFPIMMFGLPALAAAFVVTAENRQQKIKVLSIFGGTAIVSFLTGITEPIEFAFLFVSPVLFAFHALATGIFGFITGIFGIQLGFGFSAGFIDYVLSIPKSMDIIHANKTGINAVMANPGWIFPIGFLTAATYFFGARWGIKRFNLPTPGRGENVIKVTEEQIQIKTQNSSSNQVDADSQKIIIALGGKENIKSFTNCATRLRFELKDNKIVDQSLIKETKALGQVKVANGYQVIMGPKVETYANAIQVLMKNK